jgi:hypothetical protein
MAFIAHGLSGRVGGHPREEAMTMTTMTTSYYSRMLASPESGIKVWHLHVSTHGACAIYDIGPDGNATSMSTGDAFDCVLWSFQRVDERCRLVRLGPPAGIASRPFDYRFYGFDGERWRDLVKYLNRKGVRVARFQGEVERVREIYKLQEIKGSWWGGGYTITEVGMAADAEWDAKASASEEAASCPSR